MMAETGDTPITPSPPEPSGISSAPPPQPTVPEGLSEPAWLKLARANGDTWKVAERNASGEVIGTATRYPDGSKSFEAGGKRGLILSFPLLSYAGTSPDDPIFLCEGATDTAAAMTLGFVAVGLPAAGLAVDQAAALLKGLHVVVMNDRGQAGATSLKKVLTTVGATAASVRAVQPPKGVKDLRDWVRDGATRDSVSAAIATAPAIPQPDSFRPIERGSKRIEFQFVPISDLPDPQPIEWLWDGYVAPMFITLFIGIWKGGKTTMLTQLFQNLHTGDGLAGRRMEGKILIVSEEPNSVWAARREARGLGERVLLLERESFGRMSMPEWVSLIELIADMVVTQGVELVVFDTINHIWPVSQENDAGEMGAALPPLRAITEAGAAIILTHHPRKSEATEGATSRGSSFLPGFVDIIVEMARVQGRETQRKLVASGRPEGIPHEQVYDFVDGEYVLLGDPAGAKRQYLEQNITNILFAARSPLTMEEILVAWPSAVKPGKAALRSALKAGATTGAWLQSGKGSKGHGHRYGLAANPSDSFRLDTPSIERNESDRKQSPETGGTE